MSNLSDAGMWGMCVMMVLAALLFIVTLGLTVYFVTRYLLRKIRVDDRPIMVLKERYARGEINEDEYKTRLKMLTENV